MAHQSQPPCGGKGRRAHREAHCTQRCDLRQEGPFFWHQEDTSRRHSEAPGASKLQGQVSHCHGQMCRGLQGAFTGASPHDGRSLIAARSHQDLPAEQGPCSTLTDQPSGLITTLPVGPTASKPHFTGGKPRLRNGRGVHQSTQTQMLDTKHPQHLPTALQTLAVGLPMPRPARVRGSRRF